ncbi:MAG TPA: RagB/SusD family nutrient uptake outer membrane protein [Flavitalea sp.]|nr:RagB/SusD family nutrient uptake outer membrane protein [Flavitalea sp.]
MKKIFRFPIILFLLMLAGCGEDYLAVSPEHYQSADNFYKTKDQFLQAINAGYAPLQGLYTGSLWALAEMRSDNTSYHKNTADASGFPNEELDEFREVANNGPASGFFQGCYTGITRCNVILDRIATSSIDQATKDLVTGQASFLRAFYYFQLVRLYGDVPLVLKEVKSTEEAFAATTPKPASEIYAVIQSDAAVAIEKLPDVYANAVDKGRVTQGTARSLLAEVHMTLKNFTAATEQLRAVVQSAKYQLNANYASNFTLANENGTESIFEIQFMEGSTTNEFSNFIYTFAPNNSGTTVAGFALAGGSASGLEYSNTGPARFI